MIVVGIMSLFNKTIKIPFVSNLQAPRVTNAASSYVLGVVSGLSSTCCAPVLFGALSLAALSPTMLQAAGVGLAYTFGIVFPLFLLSLFFQKGLQKWMLGLKKRTIQLGTLQVLLSSFISFLLFTGSGIIFLVLALTNRLQMNDQAVETSITFKYWIDKISNPIQNIPYSQYIFGVILAGILIYFIRLAVKEGDKKSK